MAVSKELLQELLQELSQLPTTNLMAFSRFYDEKALLTTPLEEAKGRRQILDYYERMRKDIQFKEFRVVDHLLDSVLDSPALDKSGSNISLPTAGPRLCIRWESDVVKLKKPMHILGISYAHLSPSTGLIVSQVDYWNLNLRSPWLNFAIQKLF